MNPITIASILLIIIAGVIAFIGTGGIGRTYADTQVADVIAELEKVKSSNVENYCEALANAVTVTSDYDRKQFDTYYAEYEAKQCDRKLGFVK